MHRRTSSFVIGFAILVIAGTVAPISARADAAESPSEIVITIAGHEDGAPHGVHQAVVEVKDKSGKPVAGAEMSVILTTTFGELELGTYKTDTLGIAKIPLPGRHHGGTLKVLVTVEDEDEVEFAEEIGQYEEGPLARGFYSPQPPTPLVLLLIAVLSGVWLTYALALWQIAMMKRNR